MFAPVQKLPLVVGVLIMITELLYALEPVVVFIVDFLGDTLTFITGGFLIAGTGWLFNKVSSNEVLQRKKEALVEKEDGSLRNSFLGAIAAGLLVGFGHAFISSYIPMLVGLDFTHALPEGWRGEYLSSILLGISAILAFPLSIQICKISPKISMIAALVGIAAGVGIMLMALHFYTMLFGATVLSVAFSIASVSGLPFAIERLSLKHITLGSGASFGSAELFDGIFDLMSM
jgi:hypothetical protein